MAQWLYQDPPFPPSGHLAVSENCPVSGKEIKIAYFYINCFSYEFPSNSADLPCSKRGFPALQPLIPGDVLACLTLGISVGEFRWFVFIF